MEEMKVYEVIHEGKKEKVIASSKEIAGKIFPATTKVTFVDKASEFSSRRKCRWSTGLFRHWQPNEKDPKDKYGDCVFRALCRTLKMSWIEVFEALLPIAREMQCPMNWDACYRKLLEQHGFHRVPIKVSRGSSRPTVKEFAKAHPNGLYLVEVAQHTVGIEDGLYYDTWNSGHKCLYGYWEK